MGFLLVHWVSCWLVADNRAECPRTLIVENGRVDYKENRAIYSCYTGFTIRGKAERKCQYKALQGIPRQLLIRAGKRFGGDYWSGSPPICLRKELQLLRVTRGVGGLPGAWGDCPKPPNISVA